jgi:hypothetical protein
MSELAPEFFDEVKQTFDDAYANTDYLTEEGEGWDPDWVTLTTPAYEYWTDRAGAAELYEQPFPHADKDIAMEEVGRGLTLGGAAFSFGTLLLGSDGLIDPWCITAKDRQVPRPETKQ